MFKFKEESQQLAKKLKIKNNLSWLGDGSYGSVYEIEGTNNALKITTDLEEVISSFKLLNVDSDFFVNIHHIEKISDDKYGIIMEKVDTTGIEKLFTLLEAEAEKQMTHYTEIDLSKTFYNLPEETSKLIHTLKLAKSESLNLGFDTNDIHCGNIGRKNDGNFVIFDQFKKLPKKIVENEIKKIDQLIDNPFNVESFLKEKNKNLSNVRKFKLK